MMAQEVTEGRLSQSLGLTSTHSSSKREREEDDGVEGIRQSGRKHACVCLVVNQQTDKGLCRMRGERKEPARDICPFASGKLGTRTPEVKLGHFHSDVPHTVREALLELVHAEENFIMFQY